MKKVFTQIILIGMTSVLLCFGSFAHAEEETDKEDTSPRIEKVSYAGNLSQDTIIEINGAYLEECSSLSINSKNIFIESKTANKITFKYSIIDRINGNGKLSCESKNLSFIYAFPFIKSYDFLSSSSNLLQIKGSNFKNGASLIIDGGTIKVQDVSDSNLIGVIDEKLTGKEIYVEQDGLKSNILEVSIAVPVITHIYAKDGFYPKNKASVFGENITDSSRVELFIDEEIIKSPVFKDDQVYFTLPHEGGRYSLTIKNDGFISNKFDFDVFGKRPNIVRVYESSYEDDSDKIIPALAIDGKNFDGDIDGMKVIYNNEILSVSHKKGDIIYLKGVSLEKGENYFYVNIHGSYSEVFVINKKENYYPSVTSVTMSDIDQEGKRIYKVALSYYEPDSDIILYNGSELEPKACVVNVCRMPVDPDDIVGKFSIKRNTFISDSVGFDHTSDIRPYIYDIYILGFEKGSYVKINGQNFAEGTFSSGDLLQKKGDGSEKSNLKGSIIEGQLAKDLMPGENYSISFSRKGMTTTLSFSYEDIINKRVFNGPSITEVGFEGKIFIGEESTIKGVNISEGDTIVIGANELAFSSVIGGSEKIATFSTPSYFEEGDYNISIKSKSGKSSEIKKVTLINKAQGLNVEIQSKNTVREDPIMIDSTDMPVLYSVDVGNKYSDIYITNVSFTVSTEQVTQELYGLYFNDTFMAFGENTESGKIIFSGKMFLEESLDGNNISLKKISPFLEPGEYEYIFDKATFVFKSTDDTMNLTQDFIKISPYKFNITPQEKQFCLDITSSNTSYCDSTSIVNNNVSFIAEKIEEEKDTSFEKNSTINLQDRTDEMARRLSNYEKGEIYVEKIEAFIGSVSTEKLKEVNAKLSTVNTENMNNSRLISFIEYIDSIVILELSKRQ